jgi:hypothetical protein
VQRLPGVIHFWDDVDTRPHAAQAGYLLAIPYESIKPKKLTKQLARVISFKGIGGLRCITETSSSD